jgi:hypothetical protein
MKFEFVRSVENPEGANRPVALMIDRSDFLAAMKASPAQCRSEFKLLAQMYGRYFQVKETWPEEEADTAAHLLRLEESCRGLVLSIQQAPFAAPHVVYDAE